MELAHLRVIVEGLDSLAAIEKEHPVLGAQLYQFVKEVRDCCKEAYERLSSALGKVRSLPSHPSDEQIRKLCVDLNAAPNSNWFKQASGICYRLAALATAFETPIAKQIKYTSPFGENRSASTEAPNSPRFKAYYRISTLFSLLQQHERELKIDIRRIIETLESKLGPARTTGDVEDARAYALMVQQEISKSIDAINMLTFQIAGTSSVDKILTPEKIAERALQRPERVLIINMFFAITALLLGAAVLHVIMFYQFVLITGFTLTVVIVLNAFHLRTIDKLSDESFIKIVELAVLKFFAPLTRKKDKGID